MSVSRELPDKNITISEAVSALRQPSGAHPTPRLHCWLLASA